jgi:hypothetical protein
MFIPPKKRLEYKHMTLHLQVAAYTDHLQGCVLCSVNRASRYNCVKKTQLDAQLIYSIFRQPLHVSSISMPIIRRYYRMYTAIGTYYSF